MNKFDVYIADDHNVVRKGMLRLLSTFSRVGLVKDAANGRELLTIMSEKQPDAVILDVEMPVLGGVETAKIIAERYPHVKMLVLTMHTEAVFINRMMDIGVHGFLSKLAEPEEVELALYAIIDKDFYKNNIIEQALLHYKKASSVEMYCKLTNREIEILILICNDLHPGEISQRLNISEKTFFNHRANILAKTQSRSNVGLLRYAIQKGIIQM